MISNYGYLFCWTEYFRHRRDCACTVSSAAGGRLPGSEADAVFSDGLPDTERRIFVGTDGTFYGCGSGSCENTVYRVIDYTSQLLPFHVQLLF